MDDLLTEYPKRSYYTSNVQEFIQVVPVNETTCISEIIDAASINLSTEILASEYIRRLDTIPCRDTIFRFIVVALMLADKFSTGYTLGLEYYHQITGIDVRTLRVLEQRMLNMLDYHLDL